MSVKLKTIILTLFCFSQAAIGSTEFAKYGSDFLGIGVGARALALGSAYTGLSDDITALYWNPSGLSHVNGPQFHFMHSERFAGIVNWDCLLFGLPMRQDLNIALGVYRMGVDNIPLTRLSNPDIPLGGVYVDGSGETVQNVPYTYKTVNDVELAFALGFSKIYSDRLVLGGNATVIHKDMSVSNAWGIGFDFGAMYSAAENLQLGLALKNATTTMLAWSTGRNELVYPRLRVGASYKYLIQKFTLLPLADVEINKEASGLSSQIRIDRFGVNFHGGLEIAYLDRIAFRLGSNAGRFTGGFGLSLNKFSIDYGFSSHVDLGSSHRLSLGVYLSAGKNK